MRSRNCAIAVLSAASLCAAGGSARGEDFTFSFFGDLLDASGSLTGTPNGDGSFDITSGELYVTEILGGEEFALILNPNGRSYAYSPMGFFIYDNQLAPESSNDAVSYYGLLFGAVGTEINIYRDNGSYVFYAHSAAGNVVDHGEFSVEGVRTGGSQGGGEPEVPAPAAAGLICAAGAMMSRRRRAA